jgi:hypothetical protein
LSNWQKAGWFTGFMKSDFPMETVDLSALAQVPAVHALQYPSFGLAFKKNSALRSTRTGVDALGIN